MTVALPEAALGVLLLFVLPGLTWTQATFPEWRFRGPGAVERGVATAALAVLLSTGITVLVGFVLLNSAVGFSAAWTSPTLEGVLGGIAVAGAIVAAVRGAYSRTAPAGPMPESPAVDDRSWTAIRDLEQLHREQRRLRHLRRTAADAAEVARVESRLREVDVAIEAVQEQRRGQLAE